MKSAQTKHENVREQDKENRKQQRGGDKEK